MPLKAVKPVPPGGADLSSGTPVTPGTTDAKWYQDHPDRKPGPKDKMDCCLGAEAAQTKRTADEKVIRDLQEKFGGDQQRMFAALLQEDETDRAPTAWDKKFTRMIEEHGYQTDGGVTIYSDEDLGRFMGRSGGSSDAQTAEQHSDLVKDAEFLYTNPNVDCPESLRTFLALPFMPPVPLPKGVPDATPEEIDFAWIDPRMTQRQLPPPPTKDKRRFRSNWNMTSAVRRHILEIRRTTKEQNLAERQEVVSMMAYAYKGGRPRPGTYGGSPRRPRPPTTAPPLKPHPPRSPPPQHVRDRAKAKMRENKDDGSNDKRRVVSVRRVFLKDRKLMRQLRKEREKAGLLSKKTNRDYTKDYEEDMPHHMEKQSGTTTSSSTGHQGATSSTPSGTRRDLRKKAAADAAKKLIRNAEEAEERRGRAKSKAVSAAKAMIQEAEVHAKMTYVLEHEDSDRNSDY